MEHVEEADLNKQGSEQLLKSQALNTYSVAMDFFFYGFTYLPSLHLILI